MAAADAEGVPTTDQAEPRKSQATILVELVLAHPGLELFHGADHKPFAYIPIADHFETWPIRSRAFRRWVAGLFYEQIDKAPGSQAVHDALAVLEARALFDGPQREVHVRIAELNGAVYLDLGCDDWHVIQITADGWDIYGSSPVRFRRPSGMQALPHPDRAGSIEDLRPLVNVAEEDWPLFLGVLIGTLNPLGPYVVANFLGEQGSAKTTTCRIVRSLVDPSAAPVRTSPRSERDLMVAATSSWVTVIDNLSTVPDWLSDSIARLSTGGGMATRELFSDDEPFLFDACRPVLMNGITEVVTRPDLLDRSTIFNAPRLAEHRNERDLWNEFEDLRPGILALLLDAVAYALKCEPGIQKDGLPRMADFSRWAMAAMPMLGQTPDAFLNAYRANRRQANRLALEASPVAEAVIVFMAERPDWSGIAAELLEALNKITSEAVRRDERTWPRTARGLSGHLRRVAPNLRRQGIEIAFPDRSGARRELRLEHARGQASRPSQPSSSLVVDAVTVGVTVEPSAIAHPSPLPSQQAAWSATHRAGGDGGDGLMQPRSDERSNGTAHDDEAAVQLLKFELAAAESSTLDYIDQRRLEGLDFTSITGELNRRGVHPPPGKSRWDLTSTVLAYGIRQRGADPFFFAPF